MTLALDRMRELWEFSPMSATEIGARLRCSKNTVIGQATRNRWRPRREPTREPSTLHQRLDAIHARMDAVLAETRRHVEDRPKVLVAADARRAA